MENDMETRQRLSQERLREALRIFAFVGPYRAQFVGGMLLLFLSSTVFMVFPFLVGVMMDVAQGVAPLPDLNLPKIALLLLAVLGIQGLVSYFRVMMFAKVSENTTADIRKALYAKMIALPVVFFEKNRVGELVGRITADVEKIYNALYFVLAEFIRQIILLVGGILFLAFQTPRLAGIMLAVIPLIVIGAMVFGRSIRKRSKERQQYLGVTNTILDETLQSIHAVKAYTNERFELGRYTRANREVVRMSMHYASGRAIFAVFIITVLFGALFFVIWMGMRMVESGAITAGQLISFITFTAVVAGAIAGLGNFYTELVGAIGATERVRDILNTPSEAASGPDEGIHAGRFSGHVVFDNVRFAYPTRPEIEVLQGIQMSIEPGQKVAIVGQSGAGKSTIMSLLLRFHEPSSGRITVDGQPISAYELYSYRANFAIVPQEVILFGGSIRENILYGNPEADEDAVVDAARKANAWSFISAFPEGLDTVVGERGIKLSGGQRQRIAIARAILRNPSVLLLDEATSSLDAESEKTVQEALDNLMEGRTSIIIAHRLSTIRKVDRIYVLDKGRIAESGTHDQLMHTAGGLYQSLGRLQWEQA